MVAPRREVNDAGLFELYMDVSMEASEVSERTDKMSDRMEVLPLPEAPIRSTCDVVRGIGEERRMIYHLLLHGRHNGVLKYE